MSSLTNQDSEVKNIKGLWNFFIFRGKGWFKKCFLFLPWKGMNHTGNRKREEMVFFGGKF